MLVFSKCIKLIIWLEGMGDNWKILVRLLLFTKLLVFYATHVSATSILHFT